MGVGVGGIGLECVVGLVEVGVDGDVPMLPQPASQLEPMTVSPAASTSRRDMRRSKGIAKEVESSGCPHLEQEAAR